MDTVKAKLLEEKLKGKCVGEFEVSRLLDHGKSAAVFLSQQGERKYAIKIFDDELIMRYGKESQFERITRELSLTNNPHPNLVKVIQGGICQISDSHFLVMEFLDGFNLRQCLDHIQPEDIRNYLDQLISAVQHLESCSFVHRDIKPENIMIDLKLKKLTLMDLGVIRPLGGSNLTDDDGVRHFIGTLQYSPPEFLLRCEEDTLDGWRAINFYQIGAVLHDMIMKRPIFSDESQPYAALVNAIQKTVPKIESDSVDQDLVYLAKSCLIKNPKNRIEMMTWERLSGKNAPSDEKARVKEKIKLKRMLGAELGSKKDRSDTKKRELSHNILEFVKASIRKIKAEEDVLPNFRIFNEDEVSVRVDFDTSISSLNEGRQCYAIFCLEIIDEEVNAIKLIGKLCGLNLEEIKVNVYSGVYSQQELYISVESAIYSFFEKIIED